MSKKQIIIMAAAGLVSFTSMFALAWFTKKTPASPVDNSSQIPTTRPETDVPLPSKEDAMTLLAGNNDKAKKTTMTEKQLKNLIYEVQDKIKEYNNELQAVELREQRLQIAQDTIKKDLENLNNLRIELASTVASLKDQRDKLLKSRIEIAQSEKANIMKIAATYDKMESASASKILTNLCNSETQNSVSTNSSNMNDAVKILYYMTERTKAKLLAELVTSEPELAAVLCQKLKTITEKNG